MKASKKTLGVIILLSIVLVTLVSFFGVHDLAPMFKTNSLKDYLKDMNLDKMNVAVLKVDDTINEVPYTETSTPSPSAEVVDGSEVTPTPTESPSPTATPEPEKVPVNNADVLTKENYKKAKEVIEKRLNSLSLYKENNIAEGNFQYKIKQNEENGLIELQYIPGLFNSDIIESYGKFEVKNKTTGELLLDNSKVESATAHYIDDPVTGGSQFNIVVTFNSEGKKILKDISTRYSKPDESGATQTVDIILDGTTLQSKTFTSIIEDGKLNIYNSNYTTLDSYILATIKINGGLMPVKYIAENMVILHDVVPENVQTAGLITGSVLAGLMVLFIIVKYKSKGILLALSQIGFISILLILMRLTNTYVSVAGVLALGVAFVLNYIFLIRIPKLEEKSTNFLDASNLISYCKIGIPLLVIAIVMSFSIVMDLVSFGNVIIFAIMIFAVYSTLITKLLLYSFSEK